MRNARRIDENITLGRVPDADDLGQLKALGYRTVVDVREEEEKFGGVVQQKTTELGMTYVSIPIKRKDIELRDVLHFYRVVYDKANAPLYVFSRFGKKPLAFLVLLEAVANQEPLFRVYQRANRMGIDLRGDLCLRTFLVEFFNEAPRQEICQIIKELRPDLIGKGADTADVPRPRAASVQPDYVRREDRESAAGQRGCTVWLTGLPSSGKSTTAFALESRLNKLGYLAYVLDSDNIRHGLNNDLTFTHPDRTENIRRIAHVAKLFADAGYIVITSFISPYREDRDFARQLHKSAALEFLEVYIDTPPELCEQRDSRGLYKKAREGELAGFTGVDDVYEPPTDPGMVVKPGLNLPDEIAGQIVQRLIEKGCLFPDKVAQHRILS